MTKNISDKHYVERDISWMYFNHGILSEMSVEKRMETYNLKPDRADVIVPAASIFLMVADHSGAQRILVPSLGLADGIINDLM